MHEKGFFICFQQFIKNSDKIIKIWHLCFFSRFGVPDEIGGIVSFLSSSDASYITGENFVVAGGINARL